MTIPISQETRKNKTLETGEEKRGVNGNNKDRVN